jgi:hypothetical protein
MSAVQEHTASVRSNKESTLFGVRAINRAGDLSPVAFPTLVN